MVFLTNIRAGGFKMNNIGCRIRKLREKHNLTQTSFANKIGVSSGNVGDWESEKKKSTPSAKAIHAISREFNVSTDWIITGQDWNSQQTDSELPNFFSDNRELISQFNKLEKNDYEKIIDFIDFLLYRKKKTNKIENYKNETLRETENMYLPSDKFIKLPILGNVSAGDPMLAIESLDEYLEIPESIAKGGDFILQVRGDSMIEANINDGDYVIVKKQAHAENGQIVVAAIDHEATVKTIKYSNNSYIFEPANPKYEPIITSNAIVYGIVVGVYHSTL